MTLWSTFSQLLTPWIRNRIRMQADGDQGSGITLCTDNADPHHCHTHIVYTHDIHCKDPLPNMNYAVTVEKVSYNFC